MKNIDQSSQSSKNSEYQEFQIPDIVDDNISKWRFLIN